MHGAGQRLDERALGIIHAVRDAVGVHRGHGDVFGERAVHGVPDRVPVRAGISAPLVPSVTIAMVAIGAWAPALSTIYDACSPAERADIARLGVIADTAGVFLGPDGRPVPTGLDSRMIVTPGEVLAKIPSVIAVAYGVPKVVAVRAAIRGGMIHGLVTHASLARALLTEA
jgi:hypothetical protein